VIRAAQHAPPAQDEQREAAQAALADPACDGCGRVAKLTVDDRHGFHMCSRCLPIGALS
jgi:hypothetical protein